MLLQIKEGENMKLVLGIAGAAALLIGGAAVGIQANANNTDTPVPRTPVADRPIGGYEGWWNSTPVDRSVEGLPQETVTVDTRTGKIIDAYNRTRNSTSISEVDYDLVPDPAWPANSIGISGTTSGVVVEDLRSGERGVPLDGTGRPTDAADR